MGSPEEHYSAMRIGGTNTCVACCFLRVGVARIWNMAGIDQQQQLRSSRNAPHHRKPAAVEFGSPSIDDLESR